SRRRLAPPPARRGRARLAGAARARGALARRDGRGIRRRRREPAVRPPARLPRRRPSRTVACRVRHLPVHGRGAGGRAGSPTRLPVVGSVPARRADRHGNVQLWGIVGVQKETVLASRRSIATVEEIVDELDPQPGAIVLPSWVIDAVSLAPRGAHPSYAHGYY